MFSAKYRFRKSHGQLGNFQCDGKNDWPQKKKQKKQKKTGSLYLRLEVITGVLIKKHSSSGNQQEHTASYWPSNLNSVLCTVAAQILYYLGPVFVK